MGVFHRTSLVQCLISCGYQNIILSTPVVDPLFFPSSTATGLTFAGFEEVSVVNDDEQPTLLYRYTCFQTLLVRVLRLKYSHLALGISIKLEMLSNWSTLRDQNMDNFLEMSRNSICKFLSDLSGSNQYELEERFLTTAVAPHISEKTGESLTDVSRKGYVNRFPTYSLLCDFQLPHFSVTFSDPWISLFLFSTLL